MRLNESLKPSVTQLSTTMISSKSREQAWDTRGRIFPQILPLLEEGKTVKEITAITGFTTKQVRNVREHARARGLAPHPTPEETKEARSKAHQGQTCPMKGRHHSFETIVRMTETRRGRPLSKTEREHVELVFQAKKFLQSVGALNFKDFSQKYGIEIQEDGVDTEFLCTFYAVRLALKGKVTFNGNGNNGNRREEALLTAANLNRIYEQIDPGIFDRLQRKILLIRDLTVPPRNGVIYRHPNEDKVNFARAEAFFRSAGVQWPES